MSKLRRNTTHVRPFREVTELVPLLSNKKSVNGIYPKLESIEEDRDVGKSMRRRSSRALTDRSNLILF